MELAKLHATKAHNMKEIWPETEKEIKAAIKTVLVDVPENPSTENILKSRQDFKFK